jgi:hypothetical protein
MIAITSAPPSETPPMSERKDIRPPDHDERMTAARKRAQWEIGDPAWAGVIVGAYLWPDEDRAALERDTGDTPDE